MQCDLATPAFTPKNRLRPAAGRNAARRDLGLPLPLSIPALIFGTGAVSAADAGLPTGGHFSLLGALLIATALAVPLATSFALRIALE